MLKTSRVAPTTSTMARTARATAFQPLANGTQLASTNLRRQLWSGLEQTLSPESRKHFDFANANTSGGNVFRLGGVTWPLNHDGKARKALAKPQARTSRRWNSGSTVHIGSFCMAWIRCAANSSVAHDHTFCEFRSSGINAWGDARMNATS